MQESGKEIDHRRVGAAVEEKIRAIKSKEREEAKEKAMKVDVSSFHHQSWGSSTTVEITQGGFW